MPPIRTSIRVAILPVFLVLSGAARSAPADAPPPAESPAALPHTSRLQGSLSVDRRTKIVGATVLAQRQDAGATLYLTSSGEHGVFRIDGLADGDYELELHREGFAPVTKSDVNVRFPFRAVVEVKMQREEGASASGPPDAAGAPAPAGETVRLEGRITDWDGKPLSDVRLRLVRDDGSEDPRFFVTATDGVYAMEAVTSGAWRLEIEGVGFLPLRQPLELARDTRLQAILVPQPAGYRPTPLELMPEEQVLPPPDWNATAPLEGVATEEEPPQDAEEVPQSPELRTAK